MEGQFLVRQIYEDEITYNLIFAAVEILGKPSITKYDIYCNLCDALNEAKSLSNVNV